VRSAVEVEWIKGELSDLFIGEARVLPAGE